MDDSRHDTTVSLETLLAAVEAGAHDETANSLLLLECGGSVFAIDAAAIESIDEAGVIAPLPYPPESVAGVASVRGSMRLVVRPGDTAPTGRGRLVALSSDRNIAIYADRVIGVVDAGRASADSAEFSVGRPTRLQIDGRDVTMIDHLAAIDS